MKITEVVAALIWQGERFLICQRPPHKARGLLYEFVGGKVEAGESLEAALIRECREELNVTVKPLSIYMDVVHEYPDLTVHLTLFNAVITEGTPQLLEHVDIRYITTGEIDKYAFCPADISILEQLRVAGRGLRVAGNEGRRGDYEGRGLRVEGKARGIRESRGAE